jgi:hypothetical protein
VLERDELTPQDFEDAEELITKMVLATMAPTQA